MFEKPERPFKLAAERAKEASVGRQTIQKLALLASLTGVILSCITLARVEVVAENEKRVVLLQQIYATRDSIHALLAEISYVQRALRVQMDWSVENDRSMKKWSDQHAAVMRKMNSVLERYEITARSIAAGEGWFSSSSLERERASLVVIDRDCETVTHQMAEALAALPVDLMTIPMDDKVARLLEAVQGATRVLPEVEKAVSPLR